VEIIPCCQLLAEQKHYSSENTVTALRHCLKQKTIDLSTHVKRMPEERTMKNMFKNTIKEKVCWKAKKEVVRRH
jgi:hypothetical protein